MNSKLTSTKAMTSSTPKSFLFSTWLVFAPNAIDMTTVAATLRDALRHYATKPIALETLFLALKNARKLLFPDGDEKSSKFGSMLMKDVVKCVTKGASRRVIRNAKNCARVLARELSIIDPKRALKALSALSFDDQRIVEESDDEESEDDEDTFNDDEDEDHENERGDEDEKRNRRIKYRCKSCK